MQQKRKFAPLRSEPLVWARPERSLVQIIPNLIFVRIALRVRLIHSALFVIINAAVVLNLGAHIIQDGLAAGSRKAQKCQQDANRISHREPN